MKVTSRERFPQLLETVSQYVSLANNPADMVWLFSFDEDDIEPITTFRQIVLLIKATGAGSVSLAVKGPRLGKIGAINRDIEKITAPWDILVNISDDQKPIVRGYDDIIRRAMPPSLDASLWFYDGYQDRINTQEIVGRRYYERFNYIYHPSYKSFCCDNEATLVAKALGKQKRIRKSIIRHDHPQWNPKLATDALYLHNKTFWKEDLENFNKRRQIGFPK